MTFLLLTLKVLFYAWETPYFLENQDRWSPCTLPREGAFVWLYCLLLFKGSDFVKPTCWLIGLLRQWCKLIGEKLSHRRLQMLCFCFCFCNSFCFISIHPGSLSLNFPLNILINIQFLKSLYHFIGSLPNDLINLLCVHSISVQSC